MNKTDTRWKNSSTIILSVLVAVTLFPLAMAAVSETCPGCGMVWKDTCEPFEKNNETAYNEELDAAFSPVAANMTPVPDFSNRSWSEAFLAAHTLLKERYVFGQRKAVDWDALYRKYSPAIADAEERQDNASYYRTLREYLFSIPDGHLNILPENGDFGAKYADIGGGYGLSVTMLDSGKVIVSDVANGTKAQIAGIRPGDEVTGWNGREIHDAINATSYIWATKKPSTSEGILLHQQRFLTRGPVGRTAEIAIRNTSASTPVIVNLTAFDDGYDSVKKSSYFLGKQINDYGSERSWIDIKPQISNDTITTRTLDGGYTYIALYDESYAVYQPFKAAMLAAFNNKTPGIVLDLRFNSGGDDNLASCFAGWFAKEPVFYEYATMYDPGLHNFTIISEACTQPRPRIYEGPVVVLVSPDTISSGEGVPMIMNKTGRGKIISWYGTNGAFGMVTALAAMPLGMDILYPDGASLDQDGNIQVDSDASLAGGISPHIRVPLTEETVARANRGEDVQLTYALQYLENEQK